MNFKKTILLIIVLAILIGIAYLGKSKTKRAGEEPGLFPEFAIEEAIAIRINSPETKVSLSKEGDTWLVAEKDNLDADTQQVTQALESVKEIKKGKNIISVNPEKQEIFEVDPNNGFEVEIKGAGDKTLAHFYMGKTGPDYMSTYVRRADSAEVILHKSFHLRSYFDKAPDAWLDKAIIKFTGDDMQGVEVTRAEGSYALIKEKDKWLLDAPVKSETNEEEVKKIITAITSIRATKLERQKPEESLQGYGLDNPYLDIKVSLFDGSNKEITIGKTEGKDDEFYLKLMDRDIIYTIAKYNIDRLDKPWEELRYIPPPQEAQLGETARDTNQSGALTPAPPGEIPLDQPPTQ